MSEDKVQDNIQLVLTKDGSHSLIRTDMNETYHSRNGALGESRYVFIEMGLQEFIEQKRVNILEIGLGTGLNALLARSHAQQSQQQVFYHSIEKHPLPEKIYRELNYGELLNLNQSFLELHEAPWDQITELDQFFTLLKVQAALEDSSFQLESTDLIFFDAFAPNYQPDIWDPELLRVLYNALRKSGILVTYCAQGAFRRNLQEIGFTVERLPGPPGKAEMIRATKN